MATIMVVEENAMSRGLVANALERRGHNVLVASDSLDAFILAREAAPDLILLNAELPDLDDCDASGIPTILFGIPPHGRIDHLLHTIELVLPRDVVQ